MASISMNPAFGNRVTYEAMSQFQHDHSLAVLRGVLVAIGIVGIGVFTMMMPAFGPASDGAQQVASEKETLVEP